MRGEWRGEAVTSAHGETSQGWDRGETDGIISKLFQNSVMIIHEGNPRYSRRAPEQLQSSSSGTKEPLGALRSELTSSFLRQSCAHAIPSSSKYVYPTANDGNQCAGQYLILRNAP